MLDRIAGRCDAFVTVDRNLPHQQRLDGRPFAVIVLRARSNRLADPPRSFRRSSPCSRSRPPVRPRSVWLDGDRSSGEDADAAMAVLLLQDNSR